MMPIQMPRLRWSVILGLLIVAAPFVYFLFHIPFPSIFKDAADYVTYADNIIAGKGYTDSAAAFSNFREPAYPFFLVGVISLFGASHDYLSVVIAQTLLLGLVGLFVYASFVRAGQTTIGCVAAFMTVLLPSYALYTHEISTEIVFAFCLGLMFYLSIPLLDDPVSVSWWRYAAIGLLAGVGTLVRSQLVLFLPFLIVIFLFCFRKKLKAAWRPIVGRLAVACAVFLVVYGSWIAVVHAHLGTYSETTGRPEEALYLRAVRAQLSYRQITEYGALWLERSLTGGAFYGFLYDNDYQKLQKDYEAMATTSAEVQALKSQDISIIEHNLGHYLYGNVIEVFKIEYIEHDYSDTENRYLRAGVYVVLYALVIFAIVIFWRTRKRADLHALRALSLLAGLFILYNILVLTPFDTIPRYNTPYLFFYAIIGLSGVAAFLKTKRR